MKSYRKDYPRPQMVRDDWVNLNGKWDFAFDDGNEGEELGWSEGFDSGMEILVPFTCETQKSGIGDEKRHDFVWYQRVVELEKQPGKRILLHFEGSDFLTRVWVNGRFQGEHRGGYARFSFDITEAAITGKNRIVVKAEDSFSQEQPRGKQRWADYNFGCWYVQATGIWKTVWVETVPEISLKNLKITPRLETADVAVQAEIRDRSVNAERDILLEAEVSYQGNEISHTVVPVQNGYGECIVSVYRDDEYEWGIHTWTPDRPALYDLRFRLTVDGALVDEVFSYFGMRDIRIDHGQVLLNGEPLYQRLILDQGYWKESGITPPDEEALILDIDRIHQLGFNGLRKHMKTEDERFLYWCDVKGMLVWSEMAAAYRYSDNAVQEFTEEWMEIVRQNYNHPCIITWTPFNESWGIPHVKISRTQQHFTEAVYHLTRSFDPMRPVIVNDGWEHTVSDIITLHDYEEDGDVFLERYLEHQQELLSGKMYHNRSRAVMADGFDYQGQPIMISEYGGIAFAQRAENEWGYGNAVKSEEEFLARYEKITTAIQKLPYVVGFCYTQVSDVQQEVNGLMTAEREFKVSPEAIAEINRRR